MHNDLSCSPRTAHLDSLQFHVHKYKAVISILVCKLLALFWVMPVGLIPIIGMTGSERMSLLSLIQKKSFQSVFQLAAFHRILSKSECRNRKFYITYPLEGLMK